MERRSSRLRLAAGDGEGSRVTIIHAPPGRFGVEEKVDEDAEHCVCGSFAASVVELSASTDRSTDGETPSLPRCCRSILGSQFCAHLV